MKITVVKPSVEVLTNMEGIVEYIEQCGRTCYKSEDRITRGSASRFVRTICRNSHESVIEHGIIGVRVVCSRAASHQLVRHRIASYSQESQRYINYGKRGFCVICPPTIGIPEGSYLSDAGKWWLDQGKHKQPLISFRQKRWLDVRKVEFEEYLLELEEGVNPEDARYNLPNACKTELITTMNLRTWRHVFRERAFNKKAQWEIRGIMLDLYATLNEHLPEIFEDLVGAQDSVPSV